MTKPLAHMSIKELHAARAAAHEARFAADYIEGLCAWRTAVDAAEQRLRDVNAELAARQPGKGATANG